MYVPVPRHEDQGVDGDIGGDVDDVLDSPAPEDTKGPVHEDIVTGSEGDAHKDEKEISNGQVQNEQVGAVLHLGVGIHLNGNMNIQYVQFKSECSSVSAREAVIVYSLGLEAAMIVSAE